MRQPDESKPVAVLGAGAAGLTAAWELARRGRPVVVLEKEALPGGLCRTHERDGYRFDLGGHRFISRDESLARDVQQLLGEDLLQSIRKSVILLGGKRYSYPLEPLNLLQNLEFGVGVRGVLDFILQQALNRRGAVEEEQSFRDWTLSRYGRTFYELFFGPYTEKLWGIPAHELSGDWASQRISLLDLTDVVLRLARLKGGETRTYARQYFYPRKGIGQIFTAMAAEVQRLGGVMAYDAEVVGVRTSGQQVCEIEYRQGEQLRSIRCDHVISTLPLPAAAAMLRQGDAEVQAAAARLRFRGVRFLNIMLDRDDVSSNTWMYVPDPRCVFTRIQEPKRRSIESAPRGKTSLMLEIPCDEGGELWDASDEALLDRCLGELDLLGIHLEGDVRGTFSRRITHGYPVFRLGYREHRDRLLRAIDGFTNIVSCGRQGTFRYIFMDTAMEMGRMAARQLLEEPQDRRAIFKLHDESALLETKAITA